MLEALACDVPVLATPVGIHAEALAGVEGTLCARRSISPRWCAAAGAALAAPDPRVAGRASAERFSAAAMAERVRAAWRTRAGAIRAAVWVAWIARESDIWHDAHGCPRAGAAGRRPRGRTARPPAEQPGFGSRGRARRRARFLRRARELAYRDLGGLVYNLHRFGQRNDALVLAKLNTLGQIDGQLRALELSLARARARHRAARGRHHRLCALRRDPQQRRSLLPQLRPLDGAQRRPADSRRSRSARPPPAQPSPARRRQLRPRQPRPPRRRLRAPRRRRPQRGQGPPRRNLPRPPPTRHPRRSPPPTRPSRRSPRPPLRLRQTRTLLWRGPAARRGIDRDHSAPDTGVVSATSSPPVGAVAHASSVAHANGALAPRRRMPAVRRAPRSRPGVVPALWRRSANTARRLTELEGAAGCRDARDRSLARSAGSRARQARRRQRTRAPACDQDADDGRRRADAHADVEHSDDCSAGSRRAGDPADSDDGGRHRPGSRDRAGREHHDADRAVGQIDRSARQAQRRARARSLTSTRRTNPQSPQIDSVAGVPARARPSAAR